MTPEVVIYTDGACRGNPGPGGWGAVLMFGDREREIWGGEAATTNNRMELTAAIEALEALKRPCRVELHTDSQYVRNGITQWLLAVEGARLAHHEQGRGQERGPVAAAGRGAAAPRGRLALGQGPRRPRAQRTRRRLARKGLERSAGGERSHRLSRPGAPA